MKRLLPILLVQGKVYDKLIWQNLSSNKFIFSGFSVVDL